MTGDQAGRILHLAHPFRNRLQYVPELSEATYDDPMPIETGRVKPSLPLKRSVTTAAPASAPGSPSYSSWADKGCELCRPMLFPRRYAPVSLAHMVKRRTSGRRQSIFFKPVEEEKGHGEKHLREDEHGDGFPISLLRKKTPTPRPPS